MKALKKKEGTKIVIMAVAVLIFSLILFLVVFFTGVNKNVNVDADNSTSSISDITSNDDSSDMMTSDTDTSNKTDDESSTASQDSSDDSSNDSSDSTSDSSTSQEQSSDVESKPQPEPAPEPTNGYDFTPQKVTGKAYEDLFPGLHGDGVTERTDNNKEKTVYLTFDDGVSQNTEEILSILKKNDIEATFFVLLREKSPQLYRDILDQGHELALHTSTHKYDKIYSNVDSFLADYDRLFNFIVDETGYHPTLMRYPGGSVNNFNKGVRKSLIPEMERRGFTYHDWNVDSMDSRNNTNSQDIVNNVLEQIGNREAKEYYKNVVLMHDTDDKQKTVDALQPIIDELKSRGYQFKKLDSSVKAFTFRYE